MSTETTNGANTATNVAMHKDKWINWRTAARTYRNHKGTRMGMSPGLLRAREQYRVKNALTGTFITAFIVGVYWYSIMAVKQDDFTDVDEEARAMFADSRRPTNTTEGIASAARTSTPNVPAPIPSGNNIGSSGTQSASRLSEPRGVLSPWLERMHPGLVDPQRKTFVWGAPPVDAIGKISDRRP